MSAIALRAAQIVADRGGGVYRVLGRSQPYYDVVIAGANTTCTCKDYLYRQRACRHIRLVFEHLKLAPIAAALIGPALERDVPLGEPPVDEVDVDALELEAGPFGEATPSEVSAPAPADSSAPASPPADPTAALMAKWEAKRAQLAGRREQAA